MAGRIRVGVSGWRYTPWRGNFYPKKLAQARELEYASGIFSSIELNGSFYSLQRPSSYAQWARQVPPGFVFAIKGSRYITHMLKLRGIEAALANFFASGLFELGDKLGPILWQFPPMTRFHPEVFEDFFSILPRTTEQAMWIAHAHDERLRGRHSLAPEADLPLRHAVEVRHESFADAAFIALLRKYRIAWVVADTPRPASALRRVRGKPSSGRAASTGSGQAWPLFEDVTADFIYMRLHGSTELYNSRYTSEQLDRWAAAITAWARGGQPRDARLITSRTPPARAWRDVYCYFDNTDKLHAPDNARELMQKLALPVPWHPISDPSPRTRAAESPRAAGSPRSR